MKRFIFLLVFSSLFFACKSTQKKPICSEPIAESKIPVKEVKVKATIIDMSYLDGCFYILELENNDRLVAVNLAEPWLVDQKKVWITYDAVDAATVCMAGKSVKIKTIEERKE
jgi:hypothetical protein